MIVPVLVVVMAMLAAPAIGADIAKGPDVVDGVVTPHQNVIGNRSDVLVVSVIAGTFTDLGPTWVGAFNGAGYSADLIYDPAGSWPALSGYACVMVDHSDNWWSGYWVDADESVLASYQDGAGCVFLVGQDFLYARGGYAGWPANYLGIAGASEDANYDDSGTLEWQGTSLGPLDGLAGSLVPCFWSNPWFTDEIDPVSQGLVTWSSPLYGPAEGGSTNSSRYGAFSSVEFACGGQATDVALAIILYLCPGGIGHDYPGACCFADGHCEILYSYQCYDQGGDYQGDNSGCNPNPCEPSPVKITTWGRIKGDYR